jgi:Xaa-Pro aminopeptidase
MTINERIAALRAAMRVRKMEAYIIPSSDPHQSEYVADHWKTREWISGFTGSAGTVVITQEHAGLWADSRYFIQAEQELAQSEMVLHKIVNQGPSEYTNWLSEELPAGSTVGCDGQVFSFGSANTLRKRLNDYDIHLDTSQDLISGIWIDRPPLPKTPLFEHPVSFAGQSRTEKLTSIREKMQEKTAHFHLICTLDDVAWTFNIRSSDVDFNPVAIAYAVVGESDAWLFIAAEKVSDKLRTQLEQDNISLKPYEDITPFLSRIPEDKTVLIDPATINMRLYEALAEAGIKKGNTIPLHLKAIKNQIEVEGIRKAMIKDGIALTHFYHWLEKELQKRGVTEVEAAEKLAGFRRQQGAYHGESFAAIVGYQGNGAIVHYRAQPETCATIQNKGILLLDSGGQYSEGTTDITRTVALSEPTKEQKKNYTLVLKGNIAISQVIFPEGTKGIQLDILARQFLWQHLLNYGHGTGHGVGAFLNVHEPPQGISPGLAARGKTGFQAGMFTSNEPGYYKAEEYGIRIENLVLAVEAGENEEEQKYLRFETLTLFPIDTTLIDLSLLTEKEKRWLNQYHQEVQQKIAPHLDEEYRKWLEQKCAPI